MFDLVIRNGTVFDGTGAPRRVADVAVQDGRIAAVGPKLGKGRREIDAAGLMVTPGFVDIHTHYDGQATWDPFVTPSSWHGVTTTVFGNCGVGFAPVRPGKSPYLINLMEGVEDIPGTVLNEGVKFDWESFPDYLDTLASMRRAVDVAAQLPHGALRFYVMGDRGADHAEVPSEREIEEMARLTEEALRAGAMGFTTSRTTKHKAKDGRFTPSLSAREAELLGIAAGMKRAGRGVLQVNSDFGPGEFEALEAASALAGRPLSCLLVQVDAAAQAVARDARPDPRRAPGRAARQRAGRLAADRRHHGAGDDGASVRRASGMARDAQALAGRALRPPRGRRRPAPPPRRGADAALVPSWPSRSTRCSRSATGRTTNRTPTTRLPPSPNAADARRRPWRSTS